MTLAHADRERSISAVVALEIASLASNESELSLAGSLAIIKNVVGINLLINSMFWKKKKTGDEDTNAPKMGMLQRLAMKKLEKMNSKERDKLMQKALAPENIAKNKNKILATMEQMKASGQLTEEQMKMAKEKLGL
jgi:hypothetical protein